MDEPRRGALSERQRLLLRSVVEEYVSSGQPVGSKHLVQQAALPYSSSTVRSELAELEQHGYLSHPHTSAGRVPTDEGYRLYADSLLEQLEPRPPRLELDFSEAHNEIDSALQETAEVLAGATRLLALATAPSLETTTLRHVEVLPLQPQVVVVVLITSTGEVARRVFTFDSPLDPGLVNWAKEYLNERLAGHTLGSRMLRSVLEDPDLSPREQGFLGVLRGVFDDLRLRSDQRVFVEGAASLLDRARGPELDTCRRLLGALEQRAIMLELIGSSAGGRTLFVRVGPELTDPVLAGISLVGARYGLSNRPLGTVSLVGPARMDYEQAIGAVRGAAAELSRFVEAVYEG